MGVVRLFGTNHGLEGFFLLKTVFPRLFSMVENRVAKVAEMGYWRGGNGCGI